MRSGKRIRLVVVAVAGQPIQDALPENLVALKVGLKDIPELRERKIFRFIDEVLDCQ